MRIRKVKRDKSTLKFMPLGFHGDNHLIAVVDYLVLEGVEFFIETGSNVGSTLSFFSGKYPHIQCFSCEPNDEAYQKAKQNTDNNSNVKVFNMLSQDFIKEIHDQYSFIYEKKTLFWLDAHGYGFSWPLKEEIAFITKYFKNAFILIDDFKVPDKNMFGYDLYRDQECSFNYIKNDLYDEKFILYYPEYTEKTSSHHPLRGWGLIRIGEPIDFTKTEVNELIKQAENENC